MSFETPHTDSPIVAYLQQRHLSVLDQLKLSAYWLAINLHWGALLLIVIPKQAEIISPKHSAGTNAVILGIGAIVALIVPLIAGILSDRSMSHWGRRRPFIAFGAVVNLLGLAAMFVAGEQHNLIFYILGYLLVQFGNNTAGAAYSGIIPDLVPPAQHGQASGYMATMTQAGTILGAVGGGLLIQRGFFGPAYAVIALVMLVFTLQTLVNVREMPLIIPPPPLTPATFWQSLVSPLQNRNFAWVLVTRALVNLGMWCVQPFIQNYLRDVVHVKNYVEMAGNLLAIILISATITGLIGGHISDRIGRKKVVYVANTLIACCSIAFVFSHSLLYTFIVAAIYGLGYGAYVSVDWALACDALPNPEDAGKDMGIWHISMVLPQTFAPAMAGYVLEHVGTTHVVNGVSQYPVVGYQAAFGLGAFFLLLGIIFLHNVRERRDYEIEPPPTTLKEE